MGKNKGKGAANLRRLNSRKSLDGATDRLHKQIKEAGFPGVNFSNPVRFESKEVK